MADPAIDCGMQRTGRNVFGEAGGEVPPVLAGERTRSQDPAGPGGDRSRSLYALHIGSRLAGLQRWRLGVATGKLHAERVLFRAVRALSKVRQATGDSVASCRIFSS